MQGRPPKNNLERARGFHRVVIADPLKRHMQQLFDLSEDQLWGEQRNNLHARLGRTPRELYQVFGDMCRSLDPEIWIRLWCDAVRNALADGGAPSGSQKGTVRG